MDAVATHHLLSPSGLVSVGGCNIAAPILISVDKNIILNMNISVCYGFIKLMLLVKTVDVFLISATTPR
ncbi:hypothetical protein RDT67_26795 [Serratia fonticola]|uniref:Uncharacterized protein n=1 Tax=Serratia fonticola TaxID=47917 RepID=A0AAJ1YH55_SERFO|nr:hypothetical protein [Serratia fonticola]MDQ9130017.1 hypothetical protein [Serratia fonticola]